MQAIRKITEDELDLYDSIPMQVRVESIFRIEIVEHGFGGFRLVEDPVAEPWTKDYEEGMTSGVRRWCSEFDTSGWGFFLCADESGPMGAAAVASRTQGATMLDGRDDLGVLWDIRVRPESQGAGVGRALFEEGVAWCREHGLTQLKIETQNVNVPACRFYAAMGCELRSIIHHSYASSNGPPRTEVELDWWLDL